MSTQRPKVYNKKNRNKSRKDEQKEKVRNRENHMETKRSNKMVESSVRTN